MGSRILLFCDVCADKGTDDVPAQPVAVTIDGETFDLELCNHDDETYLGPVRAMLVKVGRQRGKGNDKGKAVVAEPELFPCLCSYTGGSINALTQHIITKHNTSLTNLFGDTCPVCGDGPFERLSLHARRTHAMSHASLLFGDAFAKGDVHGVVALRIKALEGVR